MIIFLNKIYLKIFFNSYKKPFYFYLTETKNYTIIMEIKIETILKVPTLNEKFTPKSKPPK